MYTLYHFRDYTMEEHNHLRDVNLNWNLVVWTFKQSKFQRLLSRLLNALAADDVAVTIPFSTVLHYHAELILCGRT